MAVSSKILTIHRLRKKPYRENLERNLAGLELKTATLVRVAWVMTHIYNHVGTITVIQSRWYNHVYYDLPSDLLQFC